MYPLEKENVQNKIPNENKKNPMYLYLSDSNGDVPPIPRFLNMSKVDERRTIVGLKTNHLIGFKSEEIVKASCTSSEIEEEFENHETSHITLNSKEPLHSTKIFQKYKIGKKKENLLNDAFDSLKENSIKDKKSKLDEVDTPNQHIILHDEVDTSFQVQTMNLENIGVYKAKDSIDEKTNLVDITNVPHSILQQNIPSSVQSTPCSLNFEKVQDHEYKFDDIPSQVSTEIRNINDKIELNYARDKLNDHNINISQNMVENLEKHTQEEWKKQISRMEFNCEDSKMIDDKLNTFTSSIPLINKDEVKGDFFACMEWNLMNRMNHNLCPKHQNHNTFYTTCNKQSQEDLMATNNYSKYTCNNVSSMECMVSDYKSCK